MNGFLSRISSLSLRVGLSLGILSSLASGQGDLKTFTIQDFSGGLNTRKSPILIQENESPDLQNVILDDTFGITRRKGYVRLNSSAIGGGASDVNSVYQLEQSNGNKYCVAFSSTNGYSSTDGCQTFTSFVSTLTRNNNVNCAPFQDRLYCVNDQYNFYFDGTNDIDFTNPANADFIRVHRNRCFAAGTGANPSRLFWSNLGACQTWTTSTDYVDIDPESGDVITGIGPPFFGMLPIYKKFSTWVLKGSTPENFVLQKISDNTGANSHRTIANLGDWQLFESVGPNGGQPGIYGFNGIIVKDMSEKIRPTIEGNDQFNSSSRRKILDTKADFDAGTFDPRALSTSREVGLIQSSYTTFTDTLGSDFASGTMTDVSTLPVSGSLTLRISTYGFTNSGFEDGTLTNWTDQVGTWDVVSASLYGSFAARSACASAIRTSIIILDSSDSVLQCTQNPAFPASIDTSGYTQTLKVKITNSSACSNPTQSGLVSSAAYTPGKTVLVNRITSTIGCAEGSSRIIVDMQEGRNYEASGTLTSRVFDTTISTPTWDLFQASLSSPTSTALTFEVQSSTSPNDTFQTLVSQSLGVEIGAAQRRYIRYKASLSQTSCSTCTPQLDSVTMAAASTGTWTSAETFLSNSIAAGGWGLFQTVQTVTGGEASISYCVHTATYSGGTNAAACTAITPGNSITNSTGAYIVVRATYTIGAATETSKTDTIIINWKEGAGAIQSSASIFKNRYHYGAQASGGTINDTIYVLDSNGAWTLWKGVVPRFLGVVDQKLVMANSRTSGSTAGFLYQLYNSDADDGGAINAYWTSKDLPLTGIENIKSVDRLSLLHKATAATLTIDLSRDAATQTRTYTKSMDVSTSFGIQQLVSEPSLNGNTFRVKFSNNAASAPWDVLGIKFHFRDLGEMQP